MLAMLTSCNNSEGQINSEDQQHQTFSGKTAARESEEIPQLTPEQEKAMIEDAVANLQENREAELKGSNEAGRYASTILCHTNYNSQYGHACVWNNGYLVNVSWEPKTYANGAGIYPDWTVYSGSVVPRCNC